MRRLISGELAAIVVLASLAPTAVAATLVGACVGPDSVCSVEEEGLALAPEGITSSQAALRETGGTGPSRLEAMAPEIPRLPGERQVSHVEAPDLGKTAISLVTSLVTLPADVPATGLPSVPPPPAQDVAGRTEPPPSPPSSPNGPDLQALLAPPKDVAFPFGPVHRSSGDPAALSRATRPVPVGDDPLPAPGPAPSGILEAASTGAPRQAWTRPGALDAWLGVALFVSVVFSILYYAALNVPPQATLYHQVEQGRVLFNRRRREILACVRSRPGATPAEVASIVGVAYNTARHHLDVLRRFSLVTSRTVGANVRYFENHGRYTPREQHQISITAAEGSIRVISLLARFPGISQKELTIRIGLAKSTVSRRLKILEAGGLIARCGRGFVLTPEGAMALGSRSGGLTP